MNEDTEMSGRTQASRSPLGQQTNSLTNASPAGSKQDVHQLRHKSSFVRRLDSSEDVPSSHGSIFVAEYLSPFNSESSSYKVEAWDNVEPSGPSLTGPPDLPALPPDKDENGNQGPPIGSTPIIYGYGTPLTTIIEQKSSIPTLRGSISTTSATRSLACPRSISDITGSVSSAYAKPPFPSNSPLRDRFSASGIIRRLESLSADDNFESITLTWPTGYDPSRDNWRGKCGIDSEALDRTGSPIDRIYAQPLRPLKPPVERPVTPPGMPSWTAAQQRRTRDAQGETRRGWGLHEASQMLSRLFGNNTNSSETAQSQPSTGRGADTPESATSSGYGIRGAWDGVSAHRRTVSAPVLRVAPRFRPPRSAHGMSRLEAHPFARAEVMPFKSDAVESAAASGASVAGAALVLPPGTVHQVNVNGRAKGKRKSGQRVRFTPSTADGVATGSEERATEPDVRVCPHKKSGKFSGEERRSSDVQMLEVAPHPQPPRPALSIPPQESLVHNSNPASPTISDPLANSQTLLLSERCQALPLTRLSGDTMTLLTPVESSFKPRSECWRCRAEAVAEKLDDMWEKGTRWCCWYCCGIEVDEMKLGNGRDGERVEASMVRSMRELSYDEEVRARRPMRV